MWLRVSSAINSTLEPLFDATNSSLDNSLHRIVACQPAGPGRFSAQSADRGHVVSWYCMPVFICKVGAQRFTEPCTTLNPLPSDLHPFPCIPITGNRAFSGRGCTQSVWSTRSLPAPSCWQWRSISIQLAPCLDLPFGRSWRAETSY